jgi:O-antigen/teichoic acid export membrane protein
LGPSVVQSERGGERRFLNTAWTLQGMRGAVIWLLCMVAWPFAHFYRDPMLVPLVIVTGLTAVISGLNSTKLLTAFREISVGRVTLIELGSQILTVAFTVAFASVHSSVWALVNAALFGACSRCWPVTT